MIDLHAHTTASDGTFSPRELVAHARELGLRAVAVTDHDTFDGWEEALAAGEELGVEIVPGIELSVSGVEGKFHLLGYYVVRESALKQKLDWLQDQRNSRNERIVAKLQELGLQVTYERLLEIAGEGTVGRPHIAQMLIEAGAVETVQQAFDVYLADGALAHLPKEVLEPQEAVALIHEAGGIAVWAHPLRPPSTRLRAPMDEIVEQQIANWKSWGLDGMEVFYGDYEPSEAQWSHEMARKYELIGTGGSDFHGANKTMRLGEVNDGARVPDEVLDILKSCRS